MQHVFSPLLQLARDGVRDKRALAVAYWELSVWCVVGYQSAYYIPAEGATYVQQATDQVWAIALAPVTVAFAVLAHLFMYGVKLLTMGMKLLVHLLTWYYDTLYPGVVYAMGRATEMFASVANIR